MFQKKTVKRSVQCLVLSQSPPGRRPNDKYSVNTSHRSEMCKNGAELPYLVATVIHTQSVRSQICVYIHTFLQYREAGRTKGIHKMWDSSESLVPYVCQPCLQFCAKERCCVPRVRLPLRRGSGESQEPAMMKNVVRVPAGSRATFSRPYSAATLTDWFGTLWGNVLRMGEAE